MLNSMPFLKRKLKNYRTMNKVGDVNLTRSMEALSEVQQRKKSLDEQLEKTEKALKQSANYCERPGDVLVPELMANQSLYVNALVADQLKQQEKVDHAQKDVDEKLAEVFKLKKTNEAVAHKMQLAKQQMMDLYFKQVDEEIAEVLQNQKGGDN